MVFRVHRYRQLVLTVASQGYEACAYLFSLTPGVLGAMTRTLEIVQHELRLLQQFPFGASKSAIRLAEHDNPNELA